MKIAILGAGFAGLATGYYFLNSLPSCSVHFFDPEEIGGGPSGLSSGLLHTHGGLHARYGWQTQEGIASTLNLLKVASKFYPDPIYKKNGVLRPAVTEEHFSDFLNCSKKFPNTVWWNKDQCMEKIEALECLGALFIPDGILIDVKKYLQGLFLACQEKGAIHIKTKIQTIEDLKEYDYIICALGYATRHVDGFSRLPINSVKGQLIQLEWDKSRPPLPYNLVCVGYVTMSPDGHSCIAGTTFERGYATDGPEPELAISEIKEKVSCFLPFLQDAKVIDCKAGIRASSSQSHLPILDRVSSNLWCITALGSKGLIYHSLLAQFLVQAVLDDNPLLIPKEVRIKKKHPTSTN